MSREPKNVVIYALCEPATNLVRYIGATTDIIERTRKHWSGGDDSTGEWVRGLREKSLLPGAMILEMVSDEDAVVAETKWIFHLSRGSSPLLNVRQKSGFGPKATEPTKVLLAMAAENRHSMRSLARSVGCSHALLSQARRGALSISHELAVRIQEATKSSAFPGGFEATRENWPKLRAA